MTLEQSAGSPRPVAKRNAPCRLLPVVCCLLVLGGCATPRDFGRSDGGRASPRPTAAYTLACPDVLEITAGPDPNVAERLPIDPDGTIRLGTEGRLRVEGSTVDQVGRQLAAVFGMPGDPVRVRVADYASRQVFLCGPVAGHERAVPYQGPETVIEFLRRVGGMTRDAEPREVHVVRANVAAGRRPEVFDVDLRAILTRGDERTDVPLQPYDQVYVGETARSNWAKYLPPWMQFGRRSEASHGN